MNRVVLNFIQHVKRIFRKKLPSFVYVENLPIYLATKAESYGVYVPIAAKATASAKSFMLEDWIIKNELLVGGNFKHWWVFTRNSVLKFAMTQGLRVNKQGMTLGVHIPTAQCNHIAMLKFEGESLANENAALVRLVNHIRQVAEKEGYKITIGGVE